MTTYLCVSLLFFFFLDFQKILRWETPSPVSFQAFKNLNFGQSIITKYIEQLRGSKLGRQNLQQSMRAALSVLSPIHIFNQTCALMLLSNLAEPEWIFSDCKRRQLSFTFCQKRTLIEERNTNILKQNEQMSCSTCDFLTRNKCYLFLWFGNKALSYFDAAPQTKKTLLSSNEYNFQMFRHMFDAITAVFPPLLTPHKTNRSLVHTFSYIKVVNIYYPRANILPVHKVVGFLVYSSKKIRVKAKGNIFACAMGSYISHIYLSDGKSDCPSDCSDEAYCQYKSKTHIFCKTYISKTSKSGCSPLYISDQDRNCKMFVQKATYHKNTSLDSFMCRNGLEINEILLNDLHPDCAPEAEDEPELKSYLTHGVGSHCLQSGQVPCFPGHSECYNISQICIYQFDMFHHLYPCRNGGHLENCKYIQCNINFQCYQSYCIQWSYVCDGKWDCPFGDEETKPVCMNLRRCEHMFKCDNLSAKCIHLHNVCDGVTDCDFSEDEILCDVADHVCPGDCFCLALAMHCQNTTPMFNQMHFNYLSVSSFDTSISNLQQFINCFPNSQILRLPHNDIPQICGVLLPENLVVLNLSHNHISKIYKHCLMSLNNIKVLQFDSNNINTLESHSFLNLYRLQLLSLSNNLLIKLPKELLVNSPKFQILYICNTQLKVIDQNALTNLHVKYIFATDFHVCCTAPLESVCSAEPPWHVSCSNLLPSYDVRIVYITNSIIISMASVISSYLHVCIREANKPFSVLVVAINVSDMFCTIYLSIIWVSDIRSEGTFFVQEMWWRSSSSCFSAFVFILWFLILNQFLLMLLSLSRLMIVLCPVDTKFKVPSFVLKCVCYIYLGSFSICITITLFVRYSAVSLPMNLCLPVIDPTNSLQIISVTTWVIVVTQTASTAIIIALHVHLVSNVSKVDTVLQRSRSDDNKALITQLAVITVTNIFCWMPGNGIFISAMFMDKYPIQLIFWSTVTNLPLNSLINPVVFIIVLLKKYFKTRPREETHALKRIKKTTSQ